MPNIDNLLDFISQNLNELDSSYTAYFSALDFKYAYSQISLHPITAGHCTYNIISGDMTGTYRFKTGFYGFSDMPAEFQKAMDITLVGLRNTHCIQAFTIIYNCSHWDGYE